MGGGVLTGDVQLQNLHSTPSSSVCPSGCRVAGLPPGVQVQPMELELLYPTDQSSKTHGATIMKMRGSCFMKREFTFTGIVAVFITTTVLKIRVTAAF